MKRIIPLVIAGVGVAVISLGFVGVAVIYYMTLQTPVTPPPFSYTDLEDLQARPDKAAAEIPRIIACFEVEDEDLRFQATETLKAVGVKAVDPLRAKLKDKNAKVRFYAVQTLAMIGPDAAGASDDILACLNDKQGDVRYKAVYALGKLGVKSDAVIDGLVKALGDKDTSVSETAIETLETIGPPSKESLPKLAELAGKDSTPAVRTVAVKLIGQIGKPAVPTIRELLKKADTLDTLALIQAIATLGPDAAPLLPDLQTIMIKSRFWDEPEALVGTFKKCGADGASGLASVLKTLHDPKSEFFAPNDDRSNTLLKAIGDMGSTGKPAVPVLIAILQNTDALRSPILETLGDIGPSAKEAIPVVEALAKNAKDNNDPAVIALRRMGRIVTIDKK
jgi:HEAT repeat protein